MDLNNLKYAPILIVTLNRYDHFKKCVESLAKNKVAKFSDLYIALDYPPSEKYIAGYELICKYIEKGIQGFANVTIIKREKNYGVKKNIAQATNYVFEKYESLIFTEDDNVFSSCFLDYMNKALIKFKDDESVLDICGYSCPAEWAHDEYNVFLSNSCFSAWGFGEWKEKNKETYDLLTAKKYRSYCKDKKKINDLINKSPRSFCYYMQTVLSRKLAMYDVVKQVYMIFENKYCLMPKISLVRNEGWDGSGVHKITEDYIDLGFASQTISEDTEFVLYDIDSIKYHPENGKCFNRLFQPSDKLLKKSKFIWKLICILRPAVFFKIIDLIQVLVYEPLKKLKFRR